MKILQNIFSVSNSQDKKHKVFTVLGFKIKFNSRPFRQIKYNYQKERIGKGKATYNYLKGYLYVLNNIPKIEVPKNTVQSNYVWSMWWQGEENAPEIVKICLQSIRNFYPQLIVIDENNYQNYIELPDYIVDKHRKGIISNAHFSDIVRVYLLQKYGGTWIDSTCFLSDYIPKIIGEQNFYIFTSWGEGGIRNWFIHSKPNHYIINVMYNFLCEYWKYENQLHDYFLFHDFFNLLANKNSYCKNLYKKQPVCLVHQNSCILGEQQSAKNTLYHNQDMYDWIFSSSFVQKLSYKNSMMKKFFEVLLPYLKNRLEAQTLARVERERVIPLFEYNFKKAA